MRKLKQAGENGSRVLRMLGWRRERPQRQLRVQAEARDAAAIVHIRGRLAIGNSDAAERPLKEAVWSDARRIVVNLAECPFLDTSGIAILVANLKRARVAGKEFILAGVSPQTASVLRVTRLHTVFTVVADVDTALAALAEEFAQPADDYAPIDGGASA